MTPKERDEGLRKVIEAWPKLTEAERKAIYTGIMAAAGQTTAEERQRAYLKPVLRHVRQVGKRKAN